MANSFNTKKVLNKNGSIHEYPEKTANELIRMGKSSEVITPDKPTAKPATKPTAKPAKETEIPTRLASIKPLDETDDTDAIDANSN